MTPQVTPARSVMWLALAALKPSSITHRTVSSMTIARVRSARSCFPLTGRRGEILVAMSVSSILSGSKRRRNEGAEHLPRGVGVAGGPIRQGRQGGDVPLRRLRVVIGQAV